MGRTNKTVRQVYCLSDLALLAGMLAAGLVFSFLVPGISGLGYTILLCWLMMVPFWHHGYRIAGQEGVFRLREITAARECKDGIIAYLKGRSETLEYSPWQKGGALVDVYIRKRDGLMLARYFDYADFAAGKEYDLHPIKPEQLARLKEIDTQGK